LGNVREEESYHGGGKKNNKNLGWELVFIFRENIFKFFLKISSKF